MKLLFAAVAAASLVWAADVNLGQPLTVKQPVAISALLAKPAGYVGKTVQVKGKITAVCQEMGCWMELADDAGTFTVLVGGTATGTNRWVKRSSDDQVFQIASYTADWALTDGSKFLAAVDGGASDAGTKTKPGPDAGKKK